MRRLFVAVVSCALLAAPAGAETDLGEFLNEVGFDEDEKRLMLSARLVGKQLDTGSDREIATIMGFFVEVRPEELIESARRGALGRLDSNTLVSGSFSKEGSLEDLRSLALAPDADGDAEEQAKRWLDAAPGNGLNLSNAEIAALRGLKGQADEDSLVSAVESQIRQLLLDRFHTYRSDGLFGVKPYERGGGRRAQVSDDLTRATEALKGIQRHAPGIYTMLGGRPDDAPEGTEDDYRLVEVDGDFKLVAVKDEFKPDQLEEFFEWSLLDANGSPEFVLTHRAVAFEYDTYLMLQRQYYVSGSYDAAQAVVAFFPYQPGCEEISRSLQRSSGCPRASPRPGTMVVYVNRTFVDPATASSDTDGAPAAPKPMAAPLERLYAKLTRGMTIGR